MATSGETSDSGILDLLRQGGAMRISELALATRVTPTAVRQRLSRMMEQGLIERSVRRNRRGRPSHHYELTEKGERQTGNNFADLAMILWNEVRAIRDPAIRRGLISRLASQMARLYASKINADEPTERMREVAALFASRDLPFVVEESAVEESSPAVAKLPLGEESARLPVLTALACPYPELAEQDRGICAFERMMFAELLETDVKLAACRLDGDTCCRFQTTN